jgi:hypothetical protein
MKRPWFKLTVATTFGLAIALACIAEAVAVRAVLPW